MYDTMHGIRGEVQIIVKVELFSDLNKFRQSSCGVQFFCCEFYLQCNHKLMMALQLLKCLRGSRLSFCLGLYTFDIGFEI